MPETTEAPVRTGAHGDGAPHCGQVLVLKYTNVHGRSQARFQPAHVIH